MASNPVFGRKSQPYQTPTQPEPTQPVAVSPQPAVAWPDDEARQTVIRTNQEAWQRHASNFRDHQGNAARARLDLAEMNRQFDELGKRIDDAKAYIAREEHYAGQEEKTRDGYAAALEILGAPVPSQADIKVHPLDTSKPLSAVQGGFPETEPDGYCNQCGDVAWRRPVSETAPKGATHSFGPTCRPEDPDSPVADLGEIQAEAVAS